MQDKHYARAEDPLARGLERVTERWSVLILRECFYGATRFEQYRQELGIAPNILTQRLAMLVEEGLLVRRAYSKHPPRFEYLLTDMGRAFRPVLLTLLAWGNKHFAPNGARVVLTEAASGRLVEMALVDRQTGREITPTNRLRRVLRRQAVVSEPSTSNSPQAVDPEKEQ
ncbi:helix-turn-helix domain-containing protein [Chitinimonas sp.]|uniref:winged helix-turn-helix transcriptional regulator n=1 Tax=Chitinimonas sp. TaxID=1934313 RepID=UPI002F91CC94